MKWKHILSIILVVYFFAMIALAVIPTLSNYADTNILSQDKMVHFAEFFIFTFLLLMTLSFYDVKDKYLIGFTVALLVVIVSELIQIPIASRSFSIKDMIADVAGVIVAMGIKYALEKIGWRFIKR